MSHWQTRQQFKNTGREAEDIARSRRIAANWFDEVPVVGGKGTVKWYKGLKEVEVDVNKRFILRAADKMVEYLEEVPRYSEFTMDVGTSATGYIYIKLVVAPGLIRETACELYVRLDWNPGVRFKVYSVSGTVTDVCETAVISHSYSFKDAAKKAVDITGGPRVIFWAEEIVNEFRVLLDRCWNIKEAE